MLSTGAAEAFLFYIQITVQQRCLTSCTFCITGPDSLGGNKYQSTVTDMKTNNHKFIMHAYKNKN